MKIVLRDDDTCFYTDPEELECAFQGLSNIPISLSLIPYAAYEHAGTFPYVKKHQIAEYADILGNQSLVEYLTNQVQQLRFELMLHGIHHEYRKNSKNQWETEMRYNSEKEIFDGVLSGKKHLEQAFGVNISTFIGPSNDISSACVKTIDNLGLHTNYIINKKFDRPLSVDNVFNYAKCNIFYLLTGERYAGVLSYKNHKEICSFEFKEFSQMISIYQICNKYNYPLVIYTHYWDLNTDFPKRVELESFIKWAIEDGATPVFMSQLWE